MMGALFIMYYVYDMYMSGGDDHVDVCVLLP